MLLDDYLLQCRFTDEYPELEPYNPSIIMSLEEQIIEWFATDKQKKIYEMIKLYNEDDLLFYTNRGGGKSTLISFLLLTRNSYLIVNKQAEITNILNTADDSFETIKDQSRSLSLFNDEIILMENKLNNDLPNNIIHINNLNKRLEGARAKYILVDNANEFKKQELISINSLAKRNNCIVLMFATPSISSTLEESFWASYKKFRFGLNDSIGEIIPSSVVVAQRRILAPRWDLDNAYVPGIGIEERDPLEEERYRREMLGIPTSSTNSNQNQSSESNGRNANMIIIDEFSIEYDSNFIEVEQTSQGGFYFNNPNRNEIPNNRRRRRRVR